MAVPNPLIFAKEIAKQAGKIIRENFTLGIKKEWKGDSTPLTEADLAINRLVVEAIGQNFPDYDLLAEEGGNVERGVRFMWLCDPIDGTIPFSHGMPLSTFALALLDEGAPIMGVVYDPFLDRMFWAEKGMGAFLNGEKISVSSAKTLKNAMVNIRWWDRAQYHFSETQKLLEKNGAVTESVSSACYCGCLVACGALAAHIFVGEKPWDSAAVKIIVEEAGGKVTDLFGNEQRYDREVNGCLATNGILHNEFVEILKATVERRVSDR